MNGTLREQSILILETRSLSGTSGQQVPGISLLPASLVQGSQGGATVSSVDFRLPWQALYQLASPTLPSLSAHFLLILFLYEVALLCAFHVTDL